MKALTFSLAALLATCSLPVIAQETRIPTYYEGGNIIVAEVTGTNEFLAYGKDNGKWTRHTFPPGVSATPVLGGNVCAFALSGETIAELVAVDQKGIWRSLKLPKPTASRCTPYVSDELAVYTIEGRAYAFSARLGNWDSIAAPARAVLYTDVALIATADQLAVFSTATAKWAVAKTTKPMP